jgi:DNA-binding LacI/PurR family transcriptional regulator
MPNVPRHALLVEKVADTLRVHLRAGKWKQYLPSERYLCDTFQVSRNTLRRALTLLQREGWIESSQGQRTRITSRRGSRTRSARSKTVGMLFADPSSLRAPSMLLYITEVRRHLQAAGYQLQVHTHPLLHRHAPGRILDSILHDTNALCWILFSCNREIQHWFVKRRVPAIVAGHCFADVRLPSLDFDGEASMRHAVGMFLSLGHRRIAFVMPKSVLAGHFSSEEAFREAFKANPRTDTEPVIVHHDSTLGGIRSCVDTLLRGPNPATGLLVAYARHSLTVLMHLLSQGIHPPKQVSLIATDDDVFFPDMVPQLTHYKLDHDLHARRLAKLALKLASTGSLAPRPVRIMPRFQRGETLGPPTVNSK